MDLYRIVFHERWEGILLFLVGLGWVTDGVGDKIGDSLWSRRGVGWVRHWLYQAPGLLSGGVTGDSTKTYRFGICRIGVRAMRILKMREHDLIGECEDSN